jgi:hypothetical protein
MSGHPFLQVIAQQATSLGDADPKSAAAAIGIITIGGGLFAPAFNNATGHQPDNEAVYERLAGAVEAITAASSPLRSSPKEAHLESG